MDSIKTTFHVGLWTSCLLICFCSCAPKIFLQDAVRTDKPTNPTANVVHVETYYAGDGLEYIIFELDLFNNSPYDTEISYRNIRLDVNPVGDRPFTLRPLNRDKIITDLQRQHREVKAERKANNIVGGISIGLNLLAIGTNSNFPVVNSIAYATESAAYMFEENRAYAMLTGSIEEQIEYVNNWVLDEEVLGPGAEKSWDIFFERILVEGPATLTVSLDAGSFSQDYSFFIRKERAR